MSKFKIGDVVKLKSGSPIMTISKDYKSGWYQVSWFLDGLPKEYDFDEGVLELQE